MEPRSLTVSPCWLLSQSDVCLVLIITARWSAVCSVLPEPSRSVRVSWPVTFALEEIAMAYQVPVTSLPAPVSMANQSAVKTLEGVC